jgi:hypothetical protein
MLGTYAVVANFHLQDGMMCRMGHICIPSRKQVKLIWEAHYSQVTGHFNVEKAVEML